MDGWGVLSGKRIARRENSIHHQGIYKGNDALISA